MKYGVLIICLLGLIGPALAQDNYAVLVQESPAGAGQILPGIGVHTFGIKEIVTLTTVPNTGWKFVCWLGDVRDPTANRTQMAVDGPKIIIAVFERDQFEMLAPAGPQAGAGGSISIPRYDSVRGGEFTSSLSPPEEPPYYPPYTPPPDNPPPVPTPEPATVLLLGIGVNFLIINRNKFRKVS